MPTLAWASFSLFSRGLTAGVQARARLIGRRELRRPPPLILSATSAIASRAVARPQGKLLDAPGIVREYGVSQSVAESWMRQLPKIHNPGGVRKTFIQRRDLEKLLEAATVAA